MAMDPDLPRNTESLGFLALQVIDFIDIYLSIMENQLYCYPIIIYILFSYFLSEIYFIKDLLNF